MEEQLINCKLYKKLSRNDTGETNSHQSGISIPKQVARSGIFPILGHDKLNPRVEVIFYDEEKNAHHFQYIYYNDIYFGKPVEKGHDEYRLTCVKDFLRNTNAKAGDSVWFCIDENGIRTIGIKKDDKEKFYIDEEGVVVIKLSRDWSYEKKQ